MREERANESPDAYYGEAADWTLPDRTRPREKKRNGRGPADSDAGRGKERPAPEESASNGGPAVNERPTPIVRLMKSGEWPESPEPMGFIDRLKERKLVQWVIAYLAMAAIALQLLEALSGMWPIPVMLQRGISLILGFGTLPAVVVAWYHGEMGRQQVTCTEAGIIGILTLIGVGATLLVCCV